MQQVHLTSAEQEFCRAYALDSSDPVGLWRDVFDPLETMTLNDWGEGFAAFYTRPEIEAEIYAQRRIIEVFHLSRLELVAELEQARVKALQEPDGAGIAMEITLEKGKLLDLMHNAPRLYSYADLLALPVNVTLLVN